MNAGYTNHEGVNYITAKTGGVPVILVHGLPSSLNEWDHLYSRLAFCGYRPLAVDLLGHGDSHKPDSRDCYTADIAYDFFCIWIDSLRLDAPFVLIGHSFGGYLSTKYAQDHPEKVLSLILIDPFLSFDDILRFQKFPLSYPALFATLLRITPLWLVKFAVWAGSLTAGENSIHSSLSREELTSMARDYKRCSPNVVYFPRTVNDRWLICEKLAMPILLIWGKKDHTLSVAKYEKLVRKLPNAAFYIIHAGHYPHRSNQDEVNTLILDFLERTDRFYPSDDQRAAAQFSPCRTSCGI